MLDVAFRSEYFQYANPPYRAQMPAAKNRHDHGLPVHAESGEPPRAVEQAQKSGCPADHA